MEVIEEALQQGKATCLAFNRRGTLLAAGTAAGTIEIWDFQTRAVARELVDDRTLHDPDADATGAILALSWSRDGRKILAAAADGSITVWDVAECDTLFRATLDAPSHAVHFAPHDPSVALVCPSDDGPTFLALARGRKRTPLPQMPGGIEQASLVCRIPSVGIDAAATRTPGYAAFSKSGDHVFVANRRGVVTVVETKTLDIVQACKVPDATIVKRLELSKDGRTLLVVSNAPSLTSYAVRERDRLADARNRAAAEGLAPPGVLTPAGSFANPTSRNQWNAAVFTHDGRRVVGASAGGAHELHCWRVRDDEDEEEEARAIAGGGGMLGSGRFLAATLERVATGTREAKGVAQMAPHPTRPLCVALGANGAMYAWAKAYDENWSAFEPGFVQLDENEVYVEREDEFDEVKRDALDPAGNIAKTLDAPEVVARGAGVEAAAAVMEAEERRREAARIEEEMEAAKKIEEEAKRRLQLLPERDPGGGEETPVEETKSKPVAEGAAEMTAAPEQPPEQPSGPEPPEPPAPPPALPPAPPPIPSSALVTVPAPKPEPTTAAPEAAALPAETRDPKTEAAEGDPVGAVADPVKTEAERASAEVAADREREHRALLAASERVLALAERLRGARSDAAAAAAAAAEAASLERAAIVRAEAEARAHAAEAAAVERERRAREAEMADVDVFAPARWGYFTDEDEEGGGTEATIMHHLPLDVDVPDEHAAAIVEARFERWSRRDERRRSMAAEGVERGEVEGGGPEDGVDGGGGGGDPGGGKGGATAGKRKREEEAGADDDDGAEEEEEEEEEEEMEEDEAEEEEDEMEEGALEGDDLGVLEDASEDSSFGGGYVSSSDSEEDEEDAADGEPMER